MGSPGILILRYSRPHKEITLALENRDILGYNINGSFRHLCRMESLHRDLFVAFGLMIGDSDTPILTTAVLGQA